VAVNVRFYGSKTVTYITTTMVSRIGEDLKVKKLCIYFELQGIVGWPAVSLRIKIDV